MSTFAAKKKVSAYNWIQRYPVRNGESLDSYYSRYTVSNMMQITHADFMEIVWNINLRMIKQVAQPDAAELVWQ